MGAPLRDARWAKLVLWSLLGAALVKADLPHVDDCYLCQKCYTGKPTGRRLLVRGGMAHDSQGAASGTAGGYSALTETVEPEADASTATKVLSGRETGGRALHQSSSAKEPMYIPPNFKFQIMPEKNEIQSKSAKRNCSECYGCGTQVTPLGNVVTSALGQNMRTEIGASPEWLFLADLPDTHVTGKKAVVKVWCMPVDKVHGTFSWRCSNTGEGSKAVQFLLAQQKVMEECGLMDVTVKVWPARVNAILPGHGLHIWWDGLWMERAEGLSLNQLSYKGTRNFVTGSLKTVMTERLNKTRVVRAAIYDLLTSQCDRHSQNVFITDTGQLKLIDNLQALQFSWTNCAMDSIFLPGTQKNAVIRWGGNTVFKMRNAKPRRSINPMVVLDYRCYVKDGRIGNDFDPPLHKCLTKLSGMTAKEIQLEYGFPFSSSAAILQQRAKDMITHGFEWTLRYGNPRSYKPKSYRQMQPCCGLNVTSLGQLFCSHHWNDEVQLPYGDPQSGGVWKRPYPDAGSYEGGTYLDEPSE